MSDDHDPMTLAAPGAILANLEVVPAIRSRTPLWRRVLRNWSVRLGCGALLLLIFVAVAAPWLGTIDPTAMDPSTANLLPALRSTFRDLSSAPSHPSFLLP